MLIGSTSFQWNLLLVSANGFLKQTGFKDPPPLVLLPDTLGCLYKLLEPSDTLSWQLQFSSYTPIRQI